METTMDNVVQNNDVTKPTPDVATVTTETEKRQSCKEKKDQLKAECPQVLRALKLSNTLKIMKILRQSAYPMIFF